MTAAAPPRRGPRAPARDSAQHLEPSRALSRPAADVSDVPRSPSVLSMSSALSRLGPAAHHPRGQAAEAALAGGIGHAAGAGRQRDRHLRQLRPLDHEHLEAVRQLGRLHLGRGEGPIGAERRLFRAIHRRGSTARRTAPAWNRTSRRFRVLRYSLTTALTLAPSRPR